MLLYDEQKSGHTRVPTTFLSLPKEVRFRIYRHVGVITNHVFDITLFEGTAVIVPNSINYYGVRLRAEFIDELQLLGRISRAVANDITTFVCHHNEILLCLHPSHEQSVLSHAPDQLLKSLRRLTIHLNVAYRHFNWWSTRHSVICSHYDERRPGAGSRRTIPLQDPWHSSHPYLTPLWLWQKSIQRLSDVACEDLHLKLIADVADSRMADLISKPLQHLRLATCKIRFGKANRVKLGDKAFHVAALTTGAAGQRMLQPFRLFDLPEELQLHILQYTGLVTPLRQVHWHQTCGYWLPRHIAQRVLPACRSNKWCAVRLAVWPPCGCWQEPSALFLVSRAMRRIAQRTFFTSNRFIFVDDGNADSVHNFPFIESSFDDAMSAAFIASQFLLKSKDMDILPWLRDIELIFHEDEEALQYLNDGILRLWSNTITAIAPQLCNLTIRVYLNHGLPELPFEDGEMDFDHAASWTLEDCSAETLHRHDILLQPLTQVKGLRQVFIRPSPPWCWPDVGAGECLKTQLYERASSLERRINMHTDDNSGRVGTWQDFTSECLRQPSAGWMGD